MGGFSPCSTAAGVDLLALAPRRRNGGMTFRMGGWSRRKMKRTLRLLAICVPLTAAASAHADCFDEAAKYQKVNPLILRAIAWQESHNKPDAEHKNANGSIDYGARQINLILLLTLAS